MAIQYPFGLLYVFPNIQMEKGRPRLETEAVGVQGKVQAIRMQCLQPRQVQGGRGNVRMLHKKPSYESLLVPQPVWRVPVGA
jgi:hypothetical protein